MRRLVCAFVARKPPKTGFLASRPKYRSMHKVQKHAAVIRKLVPGCLYVQEVIHLLKLVDYLLVHTHKPYNNLHLDKN